MLDDENSGGEEESKKQSFDISLLFPEIEHDDTTYVSTFVSGDTRSKLRQKLADNEGISAEDFVTLLVRHSIQPSWSEKQIDDKLAHKLASDDEFLEKLIFAHPEMYSELDRSKGNDKPEWKELLERGQDEAAAAFLLRAFRDYDERRIVQAQALNDKLRRDFKGLAGSLSGRGFDALVKGSAASDRIKEIIEGSHSSLIGRSLRRPPYGASASDRPELFRIPEMPENPIHETNRKLTEMAASTEEMRQLYFQQAALQENLNTVATEILDKFVKGSKDAARSSRNALIVAGIAVAATIIPFLYGLAFDDEREAQLGKQSEIIAILHEIRDDARGSDDAEAVQSQRMIELLDKIDEQTVNPPHPTP